MEVGALHGGIHHWPGMDSKYIVLPNSNANYLGMIQTLIVILIVAAAVFFVVRRAVRLGKGKRGCGCGCDNCNKCPYSNKPHK